MILLFCQFFPLSAIADCECSIVSVTIGAQTLSRTITRATMDIRMLLLRTGTAPFSGGLFRPAWMLLFSKVGFFWSTFSMSFYIFFKIFPVFCLIFPFFPFLFVLKSSRSPFNKMDERHDLNSRGNNMYTRVLRTLRTQNIRESRATTCTVYSYRNHCAHIAHTMRAYIARGVHTKRM